VPFHLSTVEFFRLVREKLAPGGILGVNLAGAIGNPFPRAIVRTLLRAFDRVEAFPIGGSGNWLVVARNGEPVAASRLASRAARLEAGSPPLRGLSLLAKRRAALDFDLADVPVLTDAYAPVDTLLDLSARVASFDALGADAL